MSNQILRTLISEMVGNYLQESHEDDLIESIFEEVSDETWEAIEEAILSELSPSTLSNYVSKAVHNTGGDTAINRLKAKSRAHKTLGNDAERKKYSDKVKQRDSMVTKAVARQGAQQDWPVMKDKSDSPVHKAADKIPKTYFKNKETGKLYGKS